MRSTLTLKRLLVAAAALGFVLGLGLAALPFMLGGDLVRAEVERVVREAGRTVAFSAPARVSLWPDASVEFDNVDISGPALGQPFASIATLRIGTTFSSLVRRQPVVEEVLLLRPIIQLSANHEGDVNFAIPVSGRDDSSGPARLILEDGEIRFRDARTGGGFDVSDVDLTVATPDGSLDAKGHVTWRRRRVELAAFVRSPARLATDGSPADLTIVVPELAASFSGRAALKDGLSLAGQVEVSSPSLPDLASWSGLAFPATSGFRNLSLVGALDLKGFRLHAKDASLAFDGMNAKGEFTLDLGGPKPKLDGKLALDRLDLDVYLPNAGEGQSLTQGWRDRPIDSKALRSAVATLAIDAGEIAYGAVRTGPATIKAKLDGGVLDAEFTAMRLYGGSARGRLEVESLAPGLGLRAALEAEKVDVGPLLRDFAGFGALSGVGNLSLSLSARGVSQLEIVSVLAGRVRATLANGSLVAVDLQRLAETALAKPLAGWKTAEADRTPFAGLDMEFALSDGVADIKAWTLSAPAIAATASGSVDLLRQRLDAQSIIRTKDANVRLAVEGPWTAPRIIASAVNASPQDSRGKASRLTDEDRAAEPPVANP